MHQLFIQFGNEPSDSVFDEVREAYRYQDRGDHQGKVVVRVA